MNKLNSILAVILLCTATTFARVDIDETNFPCQNFRTWLLEQDYGRKGYITNAEIESITDIRLNNRNITDLTGIQFFTNLEQLDCRNNQLTSLDVSALTNLVRLECQGNQLTYLNVSGLTNLDLLHCHSNQLISLDLSGLTNLRNLTGDQNQFSQLDVSGLVNLEVLRLPNNQLSSLDVSGLTNLEILNLHSNHFTSIDLTGLVGLQHPWSFDGRFQTPTLTLRGADDNYSLEIELNNLTELADGLDYFGGVLTSTSNEIISSPFRVEATGNPNFTLSGTLTLNYETETDTSTTNIVNENRQAVGFFTITGAKLHSKPQSGMFIILYDDGTSEKVMKP